jgi:hypothetical protein
VEPEHDEDRARFGTRYQNRGAVASDLQRPQNPQFHRLKRTHALIVGDEIQHTVKVG